MTRHPRRPEPRRTGAQVLTLVLILGAAGAPLPGCEDANEAAGPSPVTLELEALSPELTDLAAEVRRAFEAGDARAVERLILWREMTPEATRYARRTWLPRGPNQVADVRVEALPAGPFPPLPLEGVDYVANLDVQGVLVVEMRDVSVGELRVVLAFGEHEGRLYLAGLKPRS